MIKILVFVAAVCVIAYLTLLKPGPVEDNQAADQQLDETVSHTVLQTSGLDASALPAIADKLEQSCDRNKYELTTDECLQEIKERKAVCIRLTSQRFPEQLTSAEQMKWLVAHYENCIFQQ